MIDNPIVYVNDKPPRRFGYCCTCTKTIHEGDQYYEDLCDNILCLNCGDPEWAMLLVAEIEE